MKASQSYSFVMWLCLQ